MLVNVSVNGSQNAFQRSILDRPGSDESTGRKIRSLNRR